VSARKEQISALQGAMLVVNIVLPTSILFLPAIAAAQARQDAWLSPVVATAVGMGLAWIYTALAGRFPGKSLIRLAPEAAGWLPGKLVGVLYLWWWLHLNAIIIREFAEFMTTAVAPTTPISVFVLVTLAVCAYAVRHGIEVLGRANEIILMIMIISLLTLMLLVTNKMQLTNLMPFLGDGMGPVLKGAFSPTSWMGEVVTALMIIFPFLAKPKQARPVAMGGLAVTGVVLTLTTFTILAALGSHLTITSKFPTVIVARIIELGSFAERMEPIFLAIWVSGNFVKISIFYYAFCQGTAQLFGLEDYRPLVLPALTVLAPLAILLFDDSAQLSRYLARSWPPYAILVFELGLPVLLLMVALMRGAGAKMARDA